MYWHCLCILNIFSVHCRKPKCFSTHQQFARKSMSWPSWPNPPWKSPPGCLKKYQEFTTLLFPTIQIYALLLNVSDSWEYWQILILSFILFDTWELFSHSHDLPAKLLPRELGVIKLQFTLKGILIWIVIVYKSIS